MRVLVVTLAAAAVCVQGADEDECLVHGYICTDAGQTCVDLEPTWPGFWKCYCPPPDEKYGKHEGAATCTINECDLNEDTCAQYGQQCDDPDKGINAVGDWVCVCTAPYSGTPAVASPVKDCSYDECLTYGPVCTNSGQTCLDQEPTMTGFWRCICPPPNNKVSKDGAPAKCPNECDDYSDVCTAAGQTCEDNDPSVSGDWECVCPMLQPRVAAVGRAVADCFFDECTTQSLTCESVGQICSDLDVDKLDTWQCSCVPPTTGAPATMQPALCKYPPSDCETNGDICHVDGQSCIDTTPHDGLFQCGCLAPAVGTPGDNQPAVCILDECTATCPTCATTSTHNHTCASAGQSCTDHNMDHISLANWVCNCIAPASGTSYGKAAECTLDECTVYSSTCTEQGQNCVDLDKKKAGDWECTCPPPSVGGAAVASVTVCVLDECMDAKVDAVCTEAGQTCHDPNLSAADLNDWTCVCTNPVDYAVMAPAKCEDTTQTWCERYGSTCTSAGQRCVDTPNRADEASCECITPYTGTPQIGRTAACILDECTATCSTCANRGAGNVCSSANQTCIEGSMSTTSTQDWSCKCTSSSSSSIASTALCTINECETNGKVCLSADQVCADLDTAEDSLGNWQCSCIAPSTGSQIAAVALCQYDECIINEPTCSKAGQLCVDKDLRPTSLHDWECLCPAPATGSAVVAAAVCSYPDACTDADNRLVCETYGQVCVDTDPNSPDWECHCVAPFELMAFASYGVRSLSNCILDECSAICPTCTRTTLSQPHICVVAQPSQSCTDPNVSPLSTGDWICRCNPESLGTKVGGAAVCAKPKSNECDNVSINEVCSSHKNSSGDPVQVCNDPDETVEGDWECLCVAPYVSQSNGAQRADNCTYDECAAYASTTCEAAQQVCRDTNVSASALGDWVCECPSGVGSAVMGPADCDDTPLCTQYGSACGAKQFCMETNGTWGCRCLLPYEGEAYEGPAVCILDECTADCATCEGHNTCLPAGQMCMDPDTSPDSRSDWRCICIVGTGYAPLAKASCVLDECITHAAVCEDKGQICIDALQSPTSQNDWVCRCVSPEVGEGKAQPASCLRDECIVNGVTCTQAGQLCRDVFQNSLNDWMCVCPTPSSGEAVMSAAVCSSSTQCDDQAVATCAAAQQRCIVDGNSYVCACYPPSHGTPGNATAAVCILDECTDVCSSCAHTSPSVPGICTAHGQTCEDPNTSPDSLGDWLCVCAPPSSDSAVASAVVTCTVDECTAVTGSSARSCEHFKRYTTEGCECACGWNVVLNQGSGPGLTEPCGTACCNPDKRATGDWCVVADTAFNKASAVCASLIAKQGVCASARSPPPAGAPQPQYQDVCAAAGQRCADADTSRSTLGDWECHCTTGSGYRTMSPAVCSLDECSTNSVCSAAGQRCVDSDLLTPNTWECSCVSGQGSKALGAATCTFASGNECQDASITSQCAASGRVCVDNDTDKKGDWVCLCLAPYSDPPPGVDGPCTLDECTTTCPSCGQGVCTAHAQLCVDPNTTVSGDWYCECVAPATGKATAAVATCLRDECLAASNSGVCTASGQVCVDPTQSDLNTWQCRCNPPATGVAMGRAATCSINECIDYDVMTVCQSAGQQCYDPDTLTEHDWVCRCPAPSLGSAVMKPAQCVFDGECAKPEIAAVCTDVGQTCIDTDVVQDDTWVCLCVAPETGVNGLQRPAVCGINECTASCTSCAMHTCSEAGQTCHDPDTTALKDWVCVCPDGKTSNLTAPSLVCEPETEVPETQLPVDPDTLAPGTTASPTVVPDTLTPGTTSSPTAMPDTLAPGTTASPTAIPDTLAPGTTASPTAMPDTLAPGTTASPTAIPDTLAPGTTASPTAMPDTLAPGTTASPTAIPDTLAPGTTASPTAMPDTLAPGTTASPTAIPDTLAPGTTASPTAMPDTLAPGTTASPTAIPDTLAPGTTASPTAVPDTLAPGTTASPTAVPDTLAPGTTASPTAVPDTLTPGTTSSPTAVPDTLAPGTTASPTAVPDTLAPGTTASPTAVPDTLTPGTTSSPTAVPDTLAPGTTASPTAIPDTLAPGTTASPTAVPPSTIAPTAIPTQAFDLTTNTTEPETQLPDGVTYVPANNGGAGEADSSSSDSGSSSSLVWLIPVIVGSALVLLAGVCGAWLWVSKGRAKAAQFNDVYSMEANMLGPEAMKDMDDLEKELVVEDDNMY